MSRITSALWAGFLALILISGCATANADSADKDKNGAPPIIAVGDIHGDFTAYEDIVVAAGLSDRNGKWVGGNTIFVQTGDIADRGPDTLKIINHIRSLQKQAKRKGGQVITLVGNHEAMNMTEDLRYVHPGEYAAFKTTKSEKLRNRLFDANKDAITRFYLNENPQMTADEIKQNWFETMPLGKIEHQRNWSVKGKIGKWISSNPGLALVDGNLFAHGGISLKYARGDIRALNKEISAALKAGEVSQESIINDPLGPLWYRGYSQGSQISSAANPQITSQQEIEDVLAYFGADRMIVGHTPRRTGITSSHNGRLIEIDTGMSAHYGGTRSFLRIENGQIFAHDNGTVTQQ